MWVTSTMSGHHSNGESQMAVKRAGALLNFSTHNHPKEIFKLCFACLLQEKMNIGRNFEMKSRVDTLQ